MSAFTPGNIIVYRISSTASAAAATFLDEYTPAGTLVQSIALPVTTTGNQDELTDSGQATYSGEITESPTGSILAAGYDAPPNTASVSSSTVPRVVGIVSPSGSVDTSTTTTSFSAVRFTSAASADNQNIYVATGAGVGYTTASATGAATVLTTTVANQVAIANGQLYYSTPSGANGAGIYALGTGLPTTAGQTSTLVAASTKPVAFAFASLGGTATDTLYVADNTNGIEKFSLVGNAYVQEGTVALAGASGLSVTVTNGVATLYVTTNVTTNGVTTSTLRSIVDTSGVGGQLVATPTAIVTATSGNVFKGDVVYQAPMACFVTGTMIRTCRGDVPVEALQVGDLVATSTGTLRPIRWLGHRTLDCRHHPRPCDAMPVRIASHAFGEGRPSRDLFVSPGHAICVDVLGEVLIPAIALVNGTTIQQIDADELTYWHVELDHHDVIFAENMPAESYLDMGNRGFFAESDVVVLDATPDALVRTHADFCRPFHAEGALVDVVRGQLSARAQVLGWQLAGPDLAADVHLLVDGVCVRPHVRGSTARFTVPARACDVWLVSPTSIPAEFIGSPDRRSLGVSLGVLEIDDGFGSSQIIAVDDPRLCVGFHAAEGEGVATSRWTAGRARLPHDLWAHVDCEFFLRVGLANPLPPRWVAPAAAAEQGGTVLTQAA